MFDFQMGFVLRVQETLIVDIMGISLTCSFPLRIKHIALTGPNALKELVDA